MGNLTTKEKIMITVVPTVLIGGLTIGLLYLTYYIFWG